MLRIVKSKDLAIVPKYRVSSVLSHKSYLFCKRDAVEHIHPRALECSPKDEFGSAQRLTLEHRSMAPLEDTISHFLKDTETVTEMHSSR